MESFLSVRLVLDDMPIASDTTSFAAGARVIVLRTASTDAGVLLYSTYTGDDELATVAVSELLEFGPGAPRVFSRELDVGEGAFTYSRRFALYDHLQRLQSHLRAATGAELRATGLDVATRELDPTAL